MQLIRSRIALYAGKGPDLDRGSYEQLKQARELCSGGGDHASWPIDGTPKPCKERINESTSAHRHLCHGCHRCR